MLPGYIALCGVSSAYATLLLFHLSWYALDKIVYSMISVIPLRRPLYRRCVIKSGRGIVDGARNAMIVYQVICQRKTAQRR